MTSFFKLTVGQHTEFQRLMALRFSREDIEKIIKDPLLVLKMYEAITPTQGAFNWWRSPEQQLNNWPGLMLPEAPTNFVPQTSTEVLLLHVPQTFNTLWSRIVAPEGYTMCRRYGASESYTNKLTLVAGKHEFTRPVWLGFDPEYGRCLPPALFPNRRRLAGPEVLSAMIQFPDWSLTWGHGRASAPLLAGYLFRHHMHETYALTFDRWDVGHIVELYEINACTPCDGLASPSVRVLS